MRMRVGGETLSGGMKGDLVVPGVFGGRGILVGLGVLRVVLVSVVDGVDGFGVVLFGFFVVGGVTAAVGSTCPVIVGRIWTGVVETASIILVG